MLYIILIILGPLITENSQETNTVMAQQPTDAVRNCTECNSSADYSVSTIAHYGKFIKNYHDIILCVIEIIPNSIHYHAVVLLL